MSHPKFNLGVTPTIKTPTPSPSPIMGEGRISEIGDLAGVERPQDPQFRVYIPSS